MLLIDGCHIISRAQYIELLLRDAHNPVALLIVWAGWQPYHRLLRQALSVYLLSRGSLLRDNLRVALNLRVQTSFLLHLSIHVCWSAAWLLLRRLLMLLLLLLEVLKGRLHLEAFLKVVESRIFQATITD